MANTRKTRTGWTHICFVLKQTQKTIGFRLRIFPRDRLTVSWQFLTVLPNMFLNIFQGIIICFFIFIVLICKFNRVSLHSVQSYIANKCRNINIVYTCRKRSDQINDDRTYVVRSNFRIIIHRFVVKLKIPMLYKERIAYLRAHRVITVVHRSRGVTSCEKQRIIRTNQSPHRTRQNNNYNQS